MPRNDDSVDFNSYKLIDYSDSYKEKVTGFIDTGYKSIGYSHLELDTLDSDLTDITKNYPSPSCFMLLLDGKKLIGAKDIGVMRHIGGVDNCYEKYFVKEL